MKNNEHNTDSFFVLILALIAIALALLNSCTTTYNITAPMTVVGSEPLCSDSSVYVMELSAGDGNYYVTDTVIIKTGHIFNIINDLKPNLADSSGSPTPQPFYFSNFNPNDTFHISSGLRFVDTTNIGYIIDVTIPEK